MPAALAAVIVMMMACVSCASEKEEPRDSDMAILSIRINLANAVSPAAEMPPTRVGEEYEPDKFPANDLEKMHTVRIIIVDSSGTVEHNSLWNLAVSPDVTATGRDFPVSSNEMKRILLVANEAQAMLTLPDGKTVSASEYFQNLKASVGASVDFDQLKSLTHTVELNNSGSEYGECLHGPLAMSAIHEYYIGNRPRYSATFTIHRAAVKYTYRITNLDTKAHNVDYIKADNISSGQYFFPDADFTDETQYFHTAYRTPAGAGRREVTLPLDSRVGAGETVEFGPFYFPEGTVTSEENPYRTAFSFDGVFTGWRTLEWAMPQTPGLIAAMTDLPRNTHVIVNVAFSFSSFTVDYTVCPWNVHDNIEIPPFN